MGAIVSWFVLASFLFFFFFFINCASAVDNPNNQANQLVATLNSNRTAQKLSPLFDNAGLGCIALQYIKAYQGKCSDVGGSDAKRPAQSEFAESFAPNCGVKVSTLTPITGRLVACQSRYVSPSKVFSDILIRNSKSLDILYSKNHTEVGAAAMGTDGGSPYFWCILFSNGTANSSFVPENGEMKIERPGCFSGTDDDCSGAHGSQASFWGPFKFGILILVAYYYAFGL